MAGQNALSELARGRRAWWIIGALAALAAVAGIFTLPPIDRDESRYAQATAQMLETGDFIEINYLDEPRNKKPVGIYWLQAAAVALVSDAEDRQIWAYRLPSVLGVILAALAAFWGGQRLVGREAAFAGAALLATTVLLGIEGGIAKTDGVLAGVTTLAMAALANARCGDRPGWRTGLLFWLAVGSGVLVKGPITPLVVGLTALTLVLWERKVSWLKPVLAWWGPILAALIVLPWLISIQIATDGEFLRDALVSDLAPKLVSGHERHGGLPGYHLLLLPLLFFPATLLLPTGVGRVIAALRGGDETRAGSARFLIAWAIPTWILFEVLPTKLPHYVLPLYPALALAAGWGLVELGKAARWQRWAGWGLFAIGAGAFAVVLPVVFVVYGVGTSLDAVWMAPATNALVTLQIDPGSAIAVFAMMALFVSASVSTLVADRLRPGILVLTLAVLSGLGWQVAARGGVFSHIQAVRLADQVRTIRADRPGPAIGISAGPIVTASSFTEPSLVFSLGTDTVLGTAEEVLAFAAGREEPTMLVLDLSRDRDLWRYLTLQTTDDGGALPPIAQQFVGLGICRQWAASGTNYARGGDTTLAIFITRCGYEDTQDDPQD